jgi:hypothetical protein
MLTPAKKAKMLSALKGYKKQYLDRNIAELDESGTRLMINHFLSDVLGYLPIEEIKTEYMIKGTYADYVIQNNGIRHFLVEVKALSLLLSEKHLRQTVNYGANEGIEWALLTNGKSFEFYKILFNKPIESRKIFTVDLTDSTNLKQQVELLQYLHKDSLLKKGLKTLWNKSEALDPLNIACIIYSKDVLNAIKKIIKNKYGEKCDDEDLLKSLNRIVYEKMDPALIKPIRTGKTDKKPKKLPANEAAQIASSKEIEKVEELPTQSLN